MEKFSSSYAQLLERISLPDPALQRHAVAAFFQKLRAAPETIGPTSASGRQAISVCLRSSPAVVDQTARELCRLAADDVLATNEALLEIQAAIEDCEPRFVPVLVKAIGFLCCLAFQSKPSWGRSFHRPELHPFAKVLSSRVEAQEELIKQVILFIVRCRTLGTVDMLAFLKPFLLFTIVRIPFVTSSASFARDIMTSVTGLCSVFPTDAFSIIRLVTGCLKYFTCDDENACGFFFGSAKFLIEAFVVVLKQIAVVELCSDAQELSLELLTCLISVFFGLRRPHQGIEILAELCKRLLEAQRDLGLKYLPEFSSVSLSMSVILPQVEFEHDYLSVLKLLTFLVEWKTESGYYEREVLHDLSEEALLIFPVVSLLLLNSKSIKLAASHLLSALERAITFVSVTPEKLSSSIMEYPSPSKLHSIHFRLLKYICNVSQIKKSIFPSMYSAMEKRKCFLFSVDFMEDTESNKPQAHCLPDIHFLVSSVAFVLVLHPTIGTSAVDHLASLASLDPRLGMSVFLGILFYMKLHLDCTIMSPELSCNLLERIPSLAKHSALVPFVVQTLLPMLHGHAKPVLYAAAVRLLCKTWMVTDRVFGTIQGLLDHETFSDLILEKDICVAVAASIRDVCKHDPDRGIDLILSVSSCIEDEMSIVRALGFESLSHLCNADVVDFYSAWDVISSYTLDYLADPVVTQGLCKLLRWGAVDAEVYSESSFNIVRILWDVATFRRFPSELLWVKVQITAFKSLASYEVVHIERVIPEFKKSLMSHLISEVHVEILDAIGEIVVMVINFEHMNRRRVCKEKRVSVLKAEKLLDVFPRITFLLGSQQKCHVDLPEAALFLSDFTPKDGQEQWGISKNLEKLHPSYTNALIEISESLNLSRNLILGILTLQSWMPFTERWIKAANKFYEASSPAPISDGNAKSAMDILKAMQSVAVKSVPRVAVNVALSIGALCSVLPSVHTVTSMAAEFLLKWLFQYEHEHLQWPAAISLGLIVKNFHWSDRGRKNDVISGLIKVLSSSSSNLVKGACGIGLGFACQGLLGRVEADVEANVSEGTLLKCIVKSLSCAICSMCPSAVGALGQLAKFFPPDEDKCDYEDYLIPGEHSFGEEDNGWGAAGLVIGLGYAVFAIHRFGAYDIVLKIREIFISWISLVDTSSQRTSLFRDMSEIPLFMGSCIAMPCVVCFCQRVELVNDGIETLFNHFSLLVSVLVNLPKYSIVYQDMLMASFIGAGSFISCVLNDGIHSLKLDEVKNLLERLKEIRDKSYPPLVKLGAMLGVVNALGARAGDLTDVHPSPASSFVSYNQQEPYFIRSPILGNIICEPVSTSIIQDLFLLTKESKDQQIRRYAAWAVSFLRNQRWSKEFESIDGSQDLVSSSQAFDEDSLVLNLCLWARDINTDQVDVLQTSTIATVLNCLSKAPRLPYLDWGAIIRRCMICEKKISSPYSQEQFPKSLREECVQFSLAHAKNFGSLLIFLDELTDLSRFRMLEPNLQSILLHRLTDLLSLLPGSRSEKLLGDLVYYLYSSNFLSEDLDQKSLLRALLWSTLSKFFIEASLDSLFTFNIKKYMEQILPILPLEDIGNGSEQLPYVNDFEWSEAIRCLANVQQEWLVDVLQVPETGPLHEGVDSLATAVKIVVKAKLIRVGCIPVFELVKLKASILNTKSEGIWWNVLVEVASAVESASDSIRRQWLLDTVQISCMSEFPTTGLRFLGILVSRWCAHSPLLIVDRVSVLTDLPITLTSLLLDSKWSSISGSITGHLWVLMDRIFVWAATIGSIDSNMNIAASEAPFSALLAGVLHETCVSLRRHLPFDKQLRLANMPLLPSQQVGNERQL